MFRSLGVEGHLWRHRHPAFGLAAPGSLEEAQGLCRKMRSEPPTCFDQEREVSQQTRGLQGEIRVRRACRYCCRRRRPHRLLASHLPVPTCCLESLGSLRGVRSALGDQELASPPAQGPHRDRLWFHGVLPCPLAPSTFQNDLSPAKLWAEQTPMGSWGTRPSPPAVLTPRPGVPQDSTGSRCWVM